MYAVRADEEATKYANHHSSMHNMMAFLFQKFYTLNSE